ncbi:hypothetical protein A2Z00_02850 [Candidatus Gottesmanbacteria bacterium RBG_13_45_10]|uniref:Pseudouridine synthase n=1 Tax=Candidatus Gottesmanbacteria bacterium RBG_13_45_10 TaxID=1798370 RepID=A0A1F5ZH67_9BACT|nr:MAG: hypothetical protein A2Z00_02850 [Candidatus Gottesmanbacteria bacterium RBG_13_45_10]
MDIPILYEDDVMLVINKPPGVVVNRAQSVKGETLQDWAEEKILNPKFKFQNKFEDQNIKDQNDLGFRNLDLEFYQRAGIVHRIDKETSGCLLIAKTPQAFVELQRQFKERMVKKTYLAIVHGILVPQEGEIRAPVGRLPWNRERFGIVPGGREAVTRYRVHRSWFMVHGKTKQEITLVELFPETGRTHQIRIHLKYINHPIVGDYLYAGRKTSRDDRLWAPRTMLHAWKITCIHPTLGTPLAIEAPIPDDMNRIITQSANNPIYK